MSVHVRCPKCQNICEHRVVWDAATHGERAYEWCPNCKVELPPGSPHTPPPPEPKKPDEPEEDDMLTAFGRDLDSLIDRYAAETDLRAAEVVGMLMFKVASITSGKKKE